jgi:hypothetical protein
MNSTELELTLARLEARLAALENRGNAEALAPSYVSVDPATGVVGATFSGHVAASGIDLPAGFNPVPTNDSKVRWLEAADGSPMGEVFGYDQNYARAVSLRALYATQPVGDLEYAEIQPHLQYHADGTGAFAQVNVNAKGPHGNQSKALLRDDGTSDFQFSGVAIDRGTGAAATLAASGAEAMVNGTGGGALGSSQRFKAGETWKIHAQLHLYASTTAWITTYNYLRTFTGSGVLVDTFAGFRDLNVATSSYGSGDSTLDIIGLVTVPAGVADYYCTLNSRVVGNGTAYCAASDSRVIFTRQ